jgi:hypothetical protein
VHGRGPRDCGSRRRTRTAPCANGWPAPAAPRRRRPTCGGPCPRSSGCRRVPGSCGRDTPSCRGRRPCRTSCFGARQRIGVGEDLRVPAPAAAVVADARHEAAVDAEREVAAVPVRRLVRRLERRLHVPTQSPVPFAFSR